MIEKEGEKAKDLKQILYNISCYEVMDSHSFVSVIDNSLNPHQALKVFLDFGERHSIIYDSSKNHYEGMFTITDYINILDRIYTEKNEIKDLDHLSVKKWKKKIPTLTSYNLILIMPDDKIYRILKTMFMEKIHRVILFDIKTHNPLSVISHKNILRYLYENSIKDKKIPLFEKNIRDLDIGMFKNLLTIRLDSLVKNAISMMVKHRISCLPVVDNENKLINLYSKADIINLAYDKIYMNFKATINDAIILRKNKKINFIYCKLDDSLSSIIQNLINNGTKMIFFKNENEALVGLISYSDVSKFIYINYC